MKREVPSQEGAQPESSCSQRRGTAEGGSSHSCCLPGFRGRRGRILRHHRGCGRSDQADRPFSALPGGLHSGQQVSRHQVRDARLRILEWSGRSLLLSGAGGAPGSQVQPCSTARVQVRHSGAQARGAERLLCCLPPGLGYSVGGWSSRGTPRVGTVGWGWGWGEGRAVTALLCVVGKIWAVEWPEWGEFRKFPLCSWWTREGPSAAWTRHLPRT